MNLFFFELRFWRRCVQIQNKSSNVDKKIWEKEVCGIAHVLSFRPLDLTVVLERKIMEQSFSFAKLGVGIAILALVSLWFVPDISHNGPEMDLRVSMDNILKSLLKQEKTVDAKQQVKIAVGYGACKDLFVDAKNVIGNLKPKGTLQNFNEIKTIDDFLEMFGYFFKHGAAAE